MVSPGSDLTLIVTEVPVSQSVVVVVSSGGSLVLSFHSGDLEGDLSLVLSDSSLSGDLLLSDFDTESTESLFSFSEPSLGTLESLDEGVALGGEGGNLAALDLDLVVLSRLVVLSLLDSDL